MPTRRNLAGSGKLIDKKRKAAELTALSPSPKAIVAPKTKKKSNITIEEKESDFRRCSWCGTSSVMIDYHDNEWGVPSYDDRHLFEMLVLEGAQAGLSWQTILNKRQNYQNAFDNFDIETVAKYDDEKVQALLQGQRNRSKSFESCCCYK